MALLFVTTHHTGILGSGVDENFLKDSLSSERCLLQMCTSMLSGYACSIWKTNLF